MMEFNRPCRLCWNKESVHACPKCNISYCSLSCYQSHSNDCTEAFYKDNVENQLKSGNSVPEKERQKMAELVQKEINKIVTGEISFKSEENHETDSESEIFDKEMTGKMERMAEEENFDFGEFSEKEQNRFFNAVNSGLLNSSVIEWIPWWKSYFPQLQNGKTDIPKKILVVDHQPEISNDIPKLPRLRQIKIDENKNIEPNLLKIILGYAFCSKLYNGDVYQSDFASDFIYISEAHSKISCKNTSEAVSDFINKVKKPPYKQLFLGILTLKDVYLILQEKEIVLRALGQICGILKNARKQFGTFSDKKSAFLSKKKIIYYIEWTRKHKNFKTMAEDIYILFKRMSTNK